MFEGWDEINREEKVLRDSFRKVDILYVKEEENKSGNERRSK